MANFFLGVLASLVAAMILAAIVKSKLVLGATMADFRAFWSLTRRLRSNGVVNFFAQRSEYVQHRRNGSIPDYMRTTQHELIYVGFWLAHGVEMSDMRSTLRELLGRGCNVEFVLIDSDIAYRALLAQYLGIDEANLSSRIGDSLRFLIEFRDELPDNLRRRFLVKTHRQLLTSSAFIIDPGTGNAKTLVDFKLYRGGRDMTFGIEFAGLSSEGGLFERVTTSFDGIRESATEVL